MCGGVPVCRLACISTIESQSGQQMLETLPYVGEMLLFEAMKAIGILVFEHNLLLHQSIHSGCRKRSACGYEKKSVWPNLHPTGA